MTRHFDFVIIGAGITGLLVALRLSRLGYSCELIEKKSNFSLKAGESLSVKCAKYLKEYGFDLSKKSYANRYVSKKISWGSEFEESYIFSHGYPYSVCRTDFEMDIANEFLKFGSQIIFDSTVLNIQFLKDKWQITYKKNESTHTVTSKVLFFTNGRSKFNLIKKSKRIFYDDLIGQVCFLKTDSEKILTIEAVKNGWLYSNVLPEKKTVIAAFSDAKLIKKNGNKLFLKEFIKESKYFKNHRPAKCLTYDARTYWNTIQSGQGWFSLGDASYSADPLSGMGIEKNLEMINFLISNVSQIVAHNLEINLKYHQFNFKKFSYFLQNQKYQYSMNYSYNSRFWKNRRGF